MLQVFHSFTFSCFTIYKSSFNELSMILFHAIVFTEFYAHVYNVRWYHVIALYENSLILIRIAEIYNHPRFSVSYVKDRQYDK